MTNNIENILSKLLINHGRNIINDDKKLKAILMDSCPKNILEINLILNALALKIPFQLLNNSASSPMPLLLLNLQKQLQTNFGIEENKAEWAVVTWCRAMNIEVPLGNNKKDESKVTTTSNQKYTSSMTNTLNSDEYEDCSISKFIALASKLIGKKLKFSNVIISDIRDTDTLGISAMMRNDKNDSINVNVSKVAETAFMLQEMERECICFVTCKLNTDNKACLETDKIQFVMKG